MVPSRTVGVWLVCVCLGSCLACATGRQCGGDPVDLPVVRLVDHRSGAAPPRFVRVGQCQLRFALHLDRARGLWQVADPALHCARLQRCVDLAVGAGVDLLVLPELALSLPERSRRQLIRRLRTVAARERMLIIAGSWYAADRTHRYLVIGPGWVEQGYKLNPSFFEVSPVAGKGMQRGRDLLVLQTDWGTLCVVVCVDLISDGVQYAVRSRAAQGALDMLHVISYNPAACEFLLEANSIARRHPLFVSVTNALDPDEGDNPCAYGHTAVFADFRRAEPGTPTPNTAQDAIAGLPAVVLEPPADQRPLQRRLAFSHLMADLGTQDEAILIYDLNPRLRQLPLVVNAPDQGYPPVKNVTVVPLDGNVFAP